MAITVKFHGVLRHFLGKSELILDKEVAISIKELIGEIIKETSALKASLIDQRFEDLRSKALIIVNGKEISVLKGLETKIKDGDEIVLIPVVHGG